MTEIRQADESEVAILSDIAFRSKAYWGYDDDFMEACRDVLTVRPEDCGSGLVLISAETLILGFYHITGNTLEGELDKLFIDPDYLHMGYGTELFNDAMYNARTLGYLSLRFTSDPNAAGFYEILGARSIGASASPTIPGRYLPVYMIRV